MEPNPDFHDALLSKQRNAWMLPHCLSTKTTPIIVDFFADLLMGGIISNMFKYIYEHLNIRYILLVDNKTNLEYLSDEGTSKNPHNNTR